MAKKNETTQYDTPLTEAELKAPIRTTMLFFRRAKHFSKINNPGGAWPTIAPPQGLEAPSTAWIEWREYFERHVGQVPQVMRKMIDRSIDATSVMTVPTQFPVQFDQSFRHDPQWKPAPPRLVTPRELRASLEQLRARYGPTWGIKAVNPVGPKKPPYRSLTDDDLRTLYPPKPKKNEDAA